MKVKILISILLVLIAINLGTIGTYVYLQIFRGKEKPEWKRPHTSRDFRPPRVEMNLNQEQRQRLRQLLKEFQQENEKTRQEIWALEKDLFVLLEQDSVSLTEIKMNLQKISERRLKLMEAAVSKMIKAKSFLHPEQQKRFFDFIMESRPPLPPPDRPFPHTGRPGGNHDIFPDN